MNENLDKESRVQLAKYRLERALSTLNEIDILIENNLYTTAINRLYYSVYYAAMALLIYDGYKPATHSGVRSLLGLHYIKTGIISQDIGSNFMILFERRHRCDYDDFIETTEEEISQLKPLAESFITTIESILDFT